MDTTGLLPTVFGGCVLRCICNGVVTLGVAGGAGNRGEAFRTDAGVDPVRWAGVDTTIGEVFGGGDAKLELRSMVWRANSDTELDGGLAPWDGLRTDDPYSVLAR